MLTLEFAEDTGADPGNLCKQPLQPHCEVLVQMELQRGKFPRKAPKNSGLPSTSLQPQRVATSYIYGWIATGRVRIYVMRCTRRWSNRMLISACRWFKHAVVQGISWPMMSYTVRSSQPSPNQL